MKAEGCRGCQHHSASIKLHHCQAAYALSIAACTAAPPPNAPHPSRAWLLLCFSTRRYFQMLAESNHECPGEAAAWYCRVLDARRHFHRNRALTGAVQRVHQVCHFQEQLQPPAGLSVATPAGIHGTPQWRPWTLYDGSLADSGRETSLPSASLVAWQVVTRRFYHSRRLSLSAGTPLGV